MKDQDKYSIIGTGWSFPPSFMEDKRSVVMTAGIKDIEGSLHILLTTALRERIMQPSYGCDLSTLIFEPISLSLLTLMHDMVKDAIVIYEPRINLIDIVLEDNANEGRIEIRINYEIRGANSRYNYVYPFYLNEGTQIKQ